MYSREGFMVMYFGYLPNEIQGRILSMVFGLLSIYCDKYSVDKNKIVFTEDKDTYHIFQNHFSLLM